MNGIYWYFVNKHRSRWPLLGLYGDGKVGVCGMRKLHGKILSIDRQCAFFEKREGLLIGPEIFIWGLPFRDNLTKLTKSFNFINYAFRAYSLEVGTHVLYLISICVILMSCAS